MPADRASTGGTRQRLDRPPRHAGPWRPVETLPSPAVARLAAALAEGAGRAAALEDFWCAARRAGTPLVEPDPRGDPGRRAVTFLWRGGRDTTDVLLAVNRLYDRADPASARMRHLPGTDLWHLCYRLRADHLGSYRIAPLSHGEPLPTTAPTGEAMGLRGWLDRRGTRDPLNPRTLTTRWGGAPSSLFALPHAPRTPGPPVRPHTPAGAVRRHRLTLAGAAREVWSYLPPGHPGPGAAAGLVLLFDGDMWFPHLRLGELLDGLLAEGRIPPLAVLAPSAVDTATRFRELGEPQRYLPQLTEGLLPFAARTLGVPAGPERTLVAGQSLGGLAALYAALTLPGRFGHVLAQSSSLWWAPPDEPGQEPPGPSGRAGAPGAAGRGGTPGADEAEGASWMSAQWAAVPPRGTRLRLQVGRYEGPMVAQARRLRDVLRQGGYEAELTVYTGGHDYAWWSAGLARGLADLTARWAAR
ncbi:alpha/beta hydrolase-fold protein [Streptomyces hoynatensis]|uniref:DUF3327 domain-containing protein n=1 Tax=Streptomyces hoynatensis TaxID=1141874 RepID=A0A3A9Z937_9ACTN|nr:alpha/beta hydrolase-fold protein [Streptomyces hoynatensis]RKN43817.1 DUF3327 domain-containing protein [Streptomyces hoynatensis]